MISPGSARAEPGDPVANGEAATESAPSPESLDWTGLMQPAESEWIAPRRSQLQRPVSVAVPGWSRTENRDGSVAVTVNHTLNEDWNSRIGADFSLAAPTTPTGAINPTRLLSGAAPEFSTGTAWLSATAPALDLPLTWDKASIEARIDPAHDQGKIGAVLSKSVPLSSELMLSLQGMMSAQEPLTALVDSAAAATSRSYTFDRVVRLTIPHSGTSFAVGNSRSVLDDRSLQRISAEQKLFGHVDITGSLNETATGTFDKSIVAKFSRIW
jgi:hypothetical protein